MLKIIHSSIPPIWNYIDFPCKKGGIHWFPKGLSSLLAVQLAWWNFSIRHGPGLTWLISLVVEPTPLKNDWVSWCQLGSWNSQLNGKSWSIHVPVTTNQIMWLKHLQICHKPPHITSCLMVYTTYKMVILGMVFLYWFNHITCLINLKNHRTTTPLLSTATAAQPVHQPAIVETGPRCYQQMLATGSFTVSNSIWLVVYLPLWKIWKSSWDDEMPNWMESHKIPWFRTTNQSIICRFILNF